MKKIAFLLIIVFLFVGCGDNKSTDISDDSQNTSTSLATAENATYTSIPESILAPTPILTLEPTPIPTEISTPELTPTAEPTPILTPTEKPTEKPISTSTPKPATPKPTVKPNNTKCEHSYFLPERPWEYIGMSWPGYGAGYGPLGSILTTCTSDGFTVHVCSKCGDVYKDNYIKAYGHEYSEEETVFVYPGLTREGYYIKKCTRCKNEVKTRTIPKRAGSYSTVKAPFTIDTSGRSDGYICAELSVFIHDTRTWGVTPTIWVDYDNEYVVVKSVLKDGTPYEKHITFPDTALPGKNSRYQGWLRESGELEGSYRVFVSSDGHGG